MQQGMLKFMIGLFVMSLLAGMALAIFADVLFEAPVWGLVLAGAITIAFVAGLIVVTIRYWQRLDEAAREAHQSGWYWGGSGGLVIGMFIFAALAGNSNAPAPLMPGYDPTPANYVATGIVILALLMCAGYALGWAIWWFVKGR